VYKGRYRKRPYRHDRRDESKQETVQQRLQRLILKIGDKVSILTINKMFMYK